MSTRKIYVDSRRKIKGTNSNFTFQLPAPIELFKASRVWIDSVSLPNTFESIHQGNRFLYFKEFVGTVNYEIKTPLSVGFYDGVSLADEIATVMKNVTQITDGTYTCVYSPKTGRLTIANSSLNNTFQIWPQESLAGLLPWNASGAPSIEFLNDDVNRVIGFHGSTKINANTTTSTSHINLMPYHSLLIHSTLGFSGSIGINGENTIIRKITIEREPGAMIHDFHSLPNDYITMERGQVQSMEFWITDFDGKEVSLNNMNISFSVIFSPMD